MTHLYIPKIAQVRVVRDGFDVLLVVDGRRALTLPWDATLVVSKAMTKQARRIEEEVKALSIIEDQALLMRSGASFGLTSNPVMLEEAVKESVHNPKLRKYVKDKRKSIVGKPNVILHEV